MAIHLGANQYGKAESRVVRIYRDTPRHQIRTTRLSALPYWLAPRWMAIPISSLGRWKRRTG